MAKKELAKGVAVIDEVTDEDLSALLRRSFLRYATYVIEDRALPDARDGLKPSQRRILKTMFDLGLKPGGATSKCAKITGKTSGEFHPHGTAAIYQALARLAQDWVMRYPLVIGQGNFGNIDGDPPAAERYTETKLSPYGDALLRDLSEDVVDHILTYNEEGREPVILPGLFPNLICNGCSGIAVGLATEIPSHNLREVAQAVRLVIEKPACTLEEIVAVMPGPDFPTGGVLLGQAGVRQYYATGKGTLRVEGVYELVTPAKGNAKFLITEFPPGGNPERFVTQVRDLIDSKKIEGIVSANDLTSRDDDDIRQIHVEVEINKSQSPSLILNLLLQHTCLRETVSANHTALVSGRVRENVAIKDLLLVYIAHRKEVLTRKFTAERDSIESRLHILEGLISATKRIDDAIAIVRSSDNPEEAATRLISDGIVATQEQAVAVLKLTLRQLTRMEETSLLNEQKDRLARLAWLVKVLGDAKAISKHIIKDLDEFAAKYGDDRRTKIGENTEDLEAEDLIPKEDVVISLTRDGYARRVPLTSYKVQNRGGKGFIGVGRREEDETDEVHVCSTHDHVIFVTSAGYAHRRRGFEFPLASRAAKGKHVAGMLNLSTGETVTGLIPITGFDAENAFLVMVTKNGLIKRSKLSDYDTSYKNKGIVAIKLEDGDSVVSVMVSSKDDDVFIATALGKAIRYPLSIVRCTGRASIGVQAIKLSPGDTIAKAISFPATEHPDVVVVTSGGYGKRTNAMRYRCYSGRSAKGVNTIDQVQSDRNGLIVDACAVTEADSILVMTTQGKTVRVRVSDIRETGRATMGVKIVRLDESDRVKAIAKVGEEMENEAEAIAQSKDSEDGKALTA